MPNVLAGLSLILGPVVGYFMLGRNPHAALVGFGLACVMVAIYLLFLTVPLDVIVVGLIGAVIGLIGTKFLDWLVYQMDNPAYYAYMEKYKSLLYIFMAYLGFMVAIRKKGELDLLEKDLVVRGKKSPDVKVIDTSVLIDGRIADIAETGFLSGRIVVPRFVLEELQMVADSADNIKRQRGRRGLDILKRLQETHDLNVKIYDKDFPHVKEVDSKVVELTKELGGKLATTDFNLSKVAALQGIPVLNVNDLANGLKSVVLPGDSLTLYLAKEGKERAQAIGYLDDGTMVVVDDGRRQIGKRVDVHVNSILQTSAGRMIFSRVQDGRENQDKKSGAQDKSSSSNP